MQQWEKSEKLLGNIKHIVFSEGTYQVEIRDGNETLWPFLQIDDAGKLLDSFCSCDKGGKCAHLAAAYRYIYWDKKEALHLRFRASLWNALCMIAARRHGYELHCLSENEGVYLCASGTGRRLFFMKPLSQRGREIVDEMIVNRVIETEETSLKFSKLPPEELALWKRGTPSEQLQYELSFWSDLAKWLFLMQEKGEQYQLETKGEPLPNGLVATFSDIRVGFYIAKVNWSEIVPTLTTVISPLAVREFQEVAIRGMTYDEEAHMLRIDSAPLPPIPIDSDVIDLGEWHFAPGSGFFPSAVDPLFKESTISGKDLGTFLRAHTTTVSRFLVNTTLHPSTYPVSYTLSFDTDDSLYISAYLFEPGDLEQADLFASWAYIRGKGFYHLSGFHFEKVAHGIPKEEVGEFVSRHRHFLGLFEGFYTHLSDVESHLIYRLDEDGSLIFDTEPHFLDEPEDVKDFGEWLYVKGRGFYHKHGGILASPITPGLCVPKDEVSRFIDAHKEELEHVKAFFTSHSPITAGGLSIVINDDRRIVVEPHYDLEKPCVFYGNYVYAEGFFEIPPKWRPPEGYRERTIIEPDKEAYFITAELSRLTPLTRLLDPRLTLPRSLKLHLARLDKSPDAPGREWIATFSYISELGEVKMDALFAAVQEGKSYLTSEAGLIFLKDHRFTWLRELQRDPLIAEERLVLTTLEWIRMGIFEELDVAPEAAETLEEIRTFKTPLPLSYPDLKSTLRPYQELGAQWLWFLYSHGLSGILCDDMGLGKTHQAMALIAGVNNLRRRKYIITCPTSVIYHWEELLGKYLPALRVRTYYGLKRTLDLFAQKADILLTSYGILRSDREKLAEINFEVAIFDELQLAKNAHSQIHKSLKELACKTKIGLSGTPIENRLSELKALFDILLPGYLPPPAAFREQFVTPIEKHHDQEKKHLLSRMVSPFLLRRRKSEVLDDLPEKIEEVLRCDLSKHQKELYDAYVERESEAIIDTLKDASQKVPTMHIFSLLSKLKQICDHPALVAKDVKQVSRLRSGKWDLFLELLSETRDSGQKVVVFSQYLDMLTIIENYLRDNNIGFASIRGATRDRKRQLERFRDDPQCEVFVASLQAAGVGIDLTAASVVIHYDRWWNPAKENQATDRVHRIGQKRGVQVFKLVTKHSVEEHIHALIERKKGLIESLIGYDDQDQLKAFSRDELISLFQRLCCKN